MLKKKEQSCQSCEKERQMTKVTEEALKQAVDLALSLLDNFDRLNR